MHRTNKLLPRDDPPDHDPCYKFIQEEDCRSRDSGKLSFSLTEVELFYFVYFSIPAAQKVSVTEIVLIFNCA